MTEWLEKLPESLTATIAEAAAEVLNALPGEAVPASLRPLLGFDRRKLASATARRQLLRALTRDTSFHEAVERALRLDDAVVAMLADLEGGDASEAVGVAAERGDLPLLVAALWAERPDGFEFALGCAAGIARGDAARRDAIEEAEALARRVEEQSAARRRADEQRITAEARATRLSDELRDERAARRGREEQALAHSAAAERRADAAEAALAAERGRALGFEQTARREAERAEQLESQRRALADELGPRGLSSGAAVSVEELSSAARQAAQLAERLRVLEAGATRIGAPSTRSEPGAPSASPVGAASRPAAPDRRTPPPLPAGLVADSPDGIVAMLQPGTLLVVDGYNVSHRAWPDAPIGDQRERLGRALHQLHRRLGAKVVCCFDGEGDVGVQPMRRDGLRVLFSQTGEEADELVIKVVEGQPKRVPVVVASSDAWVREHAEIAGAVVVSAATMVAGLTAASRRP